MKRTALFFFLFFYGILFFLLLPGYRYIIDPDATGYIRIAERVAAGDYARSVNGLWSPLNAWLLVPFLKIGVNAVMAAKYLNGIFSCAAIIAVFFLLKKLVLHRYAELGIMTAISILLLHYTFHELFADLLLVLMLLIYLNIICSKNFINNNLKIIGCGLICAVGFYAKAYFFYFAIIHLAVSIFILLKVRQQKFNWRKWFTVTAMALIIVVIAVIPWAMALQSKYEKGFTISTAGKFNQTWVLSAAYPQPGQLIMPPHYDDAYSFWDDPSYWPVKNINPFTNKTVFMFQLKLLFSNTLESIDVFNDFSFLSITVMLVLLFLLLSGNKIFIQQKNNLVLFAFLCVFPIGYIILHVEPRFFWILNIVLIIFAGILLSMVQQAGYLKKSSFGICCIIAFGSFILYPVNKLQDQYNEGKDNFEMAAAFKKNNIHGKIISNCTSSDEQARSLAVCYLINSQNYGPANIDHSEEEILQAIREYKIDHYVMYYHFPYEKEMILSSALAKNAVSVRDDIYPGLIVLTYQ
ncbi:MAG: hypothetical protein ABJA78_08370 [Ferruginibacter sp.]